jgi:YidC/Oxa1 family membrane protein insertase
MYILGTPMGWVMWAISRVVSIYALSLFLFTVIVNLCLMPLNIKQQKSTSKMTLLQPELAELQKQYGSNKEKYQQEMMKVYQREKYNPMSGCLPLLIQMPILFGMIDVIYNPLTHLIRLPAGTIAIAENILSHLNVGQAYTSFNVQLAIIRAIRETPRAFSALGGEALASIQSLNMSFFGIDLTDVPSFGMLTGMFSGGWNPVVLIPILSGLSALVVSLISIRQAAQNPNAATGNNMKGMMLIMPIFSTMFAFSVAGGVGLYWFYSNVVSIGRTLLMNKLYNPREMAEEAKRAFEERQQLARQERIEARRKLKQGAPLDEKTKEIALTGKEASRRKLAEARRRDAEKYGEEYVEVTDDDLV